MSSAYLFKAPWKRSLAAVLDRLGGAFYPFLTPKTPGFDSSLVKKILLIRLDHIGDVMMVRPVLQGIQHAFPAASIDWMISSEFLPLLAGEPSIRRFVGVPRHWFQREGTFYQKYGSFFKLAKDIKHERYDLGIDFRGDFRNIFLMERAGIPSRLSYAVTGGKFLLTHCGHYERGTHQTELNRRLLEPLGFSIKIGNSPILRDEAAYAAFKKNFPSIHHPEKKRLILHSGAGYPSKRWPSNHYRALISELIRKQVCDIILIGTKAERSELPIVEYPGKLHDLRGMLALEDLPMLMNAGHYYIGSDSGPAHIAAAQGIPGIILFSGANDSRVWRPVSDTLTVIEYKVPCSPCESKECPLKHHECMTEISPESVTARVIDFFQKNPSGAHS